MPCDRDDDEPSLERCRDDVALSYLPLPIVRGSPVPEVPKGSAPAATLDTPPEGHEVIPVKTIRPRRDANFQVSVQQPASLGLVQGHDAQGVFVEVGTSLFYADYVEFGTSRQRAEPFMRPAISAVRR